MKLKKALQMLRSNIKREPWLALNSVFVIAQAVITLNIFIFLLVGSGVVLHYLERRAQISVYFTDATTEESILKVKENLEKDERIHEVNYVSKEEALEIFKEATKDEPALVESLQSNPLPASLEVKSDKIENLDVLSEELKKRDGVEEVKFYKDVVSTFRRWSNILRISSVMLLVVLILESMVVIWMTVGITIHSKGLEVEILKLVGASDKYVKAPLVLQGVFYGVGAAFISTLLIYGVLPFVAPVIGGIVKGISVEIGPLEFIYWAPFFGKSMSVLDRIASFVAFASLQTLFGIALGFMGSAFAIKKYLKY
ncbi:MAG: permease-like cell division protein FtsX [Patescibacteria group bacterium]